MRNRYSELSQQLQSAEPGSSQQFDALLQIQDIENHNSEKHLVNLSSREDMRRFLQTREFFEFVDTSTFSLEELKSFCLCELAELHHRDAVSRHHDEEFKIGIL